MTVTDDLALLLHTDAGRPLADRSALPRLLAGAQLVDLVLAGRVALAGHRARFQVVHRVSTGDPVLDAALDRLPDAGSIAAGVGALRRGAVERVLAHLVAAGVLTAGRRRVLGVLPVAAWPSTSPARRAALVGRLRGVLLGSEPGGDPEEPDAAAAALVALLDAGGHLPAVLDVPRRRVRRRVAEIADGDRVSAATRSAVAAARAVRLAVVAAAAAPTGQPGG